ncbi:T9SS type A sorting domain-containing protein [candidate division WOR-3 bacterium]|nr:T9SS type A sorting domain-containing protein [candidate division WOR-3 bacterium]
MLKLFKMIFIILLTSSSFVGNTYAKSREVYLLPSLNGELSKVVPSDKDGAWWLLQYDGGESNYYLSGLYADDTLGVFFKPPAPCTLVEVHFCKYMYEDEGLYTYWGIAADVPDGVTLGDYGEYHSAASMPGPSAIGTIFATGKFDFPFTEGWQWDTLSIPGTPDIGTDAFWAGTVIGDSLSHSTRIDADVNPPYHAVCWKQGGVGPETNGPGWYASWHLFWVRALVKIYWTEYLDCYVEELRGTYSTQDRTVHVYTDDFHPHPESLGIYPDSAFLKYTVNDGDTMVVLLIQDSVHSLPPFEHAWWHGSIPGQIPVAEVTYWVQLTFISGYTGISHSYVYKVGAGIHDFGLLYIEADEALGVMGVHNAFSGLPWDLWWENEGGIADSTVTNFYTTGAGARAVSWLAFTGNSFTDTYEPGWSYTQTFMDFMDNGGCLFLGGQDIPGGGYGLGYGEWEAPPSPHPLRDYLKAYAGDDDYILLSPFTVTVDNTDILTIGLSDELTVDCSSISQSTWIGIFTELDEDCVPLFFDDEGNILGYRYEDATYGFKVIFLYFPFHAITDTNAQNIFIENITNWFGVGVEEEPVESIYDLPMVTPNPLLSSATINFSIPKKEYVSIKVYDITGSLVSLLADKRFNSGNHTLKLNTDGLASGVYFLRMDSGDFSGTRKFLVIR